MNVKKKILIARSLSAHREPVFILDIFPQPSFCACLYKKIFFLDEMGLCYYILVICIFNKQFTYMFSQTNQHHHILMKVVWYLVFKYYSLWTPLAVQQLRLCASNAGPQAQSPVRELGFHMLQSEVKTKQNKTLF